MSTTAPTLVAVEQVVEDAVASFRNNLAVTGGGRYVSVRHNSEFEATKASPQADFSRVRSRESSWISLFSPAIPTRAQPGT